MKEQIIQKGDIFGEELKHHILRRLSEIIVGKETNITSSILEFLIEQTLLEKSEKVMISREKIALGIKEIFLLKFSIEELEEPLQNLITAGRVKASNKIFCLVIDRFGELKKRNAETKRFEKQILNEWWDKISIQIGFMEGFIKYTKLFGRSGLPALIDHVYAEYRKPRRIY